MKGLLLKDAYQMWYYTRMLILAAVVMMLVGVFGMKALISLCCTVGFCWGYSP